MLNRVTLIGNLGQAPQFKKTQTGQDVVFFSIATHSFWKSNYWKASSWQVPPREGNEQTGEWSKRVDWHQVTVFKESTIRWMKDSLRKGDRVCVEGKLMYKKRPDQFGKNHTDAYVVVSDREGWVEHIRDHKLISATQNLDPRNEEFHNEELHDEEPHNGDSTSQPEGRF